jgi:hypothetical protein
MNSDSEVGCDGLGNNIFEILSVSLIYRTNNEPIMQN